MSAGSYNDLFFFSDRAKVTKGLPDVVAIREGKVRQRQKNILLRDTIILRCDITVILLFEGGVQESDG